MKRGDKFSCSFEVSESIYRGFRDLFQDRNPLHTDAAFAREKGFEREVMFGNILNGYISYFVGQCLPIRNVLIHKQEIKYHHAVYLNDALTLCATVTEVFDSVNAVKMKYYFQNQDDKKVAKGKLQIGVLE
ncbi:MAG: MaoC/PaaZ C-terminal domain-containing protein [Thermodesulfobacteriota bacterium]|nr:MaoC/PaaZ C-terminal domain-containing protein [Thermodesulfobacteriota bacterium]